MRPGMWMYFRTLSGAEELRRVLDVDRVASSCWFDPPHFQHVDEVPESRWRVVDVHKVEAHDDGSRSRCRGRFPRT
jgi:hypothetical protein